MCACAMGGWSMWLAGILFWVVLIGLGIWAVRTFSRRGAPSGARSLLEERFVRGEIGAEEFGARSRVLEGSDG